MHRVSTCGFSRLVVGAGLATLLGSCASTPPPEAPPARDRAQQELVRESQPAEVQVESPASGETRPREHIVERGSGSFIRSARVPRDDGTDASSGDINLRFEDTDIKEFIRVVLSDILAANYTIDPSVVGRVTMHTSTGITADQLLPLFEEVLAMNDAVLARVGSLYHVMPRSRAVQRTEAPAVIGGDPTGFGTRVVPLRFISAREMQQVLERVVANPSGIRIDAARNIIIASGSGAELRAIQETIDIFDVDWLRGMSMGIYPLDHVDPRTLEFELRQVIAAVSGDGGSEVLGGVVRLVPLERLTALLVVSSTPAGLRETEIWIRRLDQPSDSAEQRLYVYDVQNAKAPELASILGSVFRSRSAGSSSALATGERRSSAPPLAPGLTPVEIAPQDAGTASAARSILPEQASTGDRLSFVTGGPVEIIADDVRNALVILASPQDYRMVEAALRRLDVVPLQVLIEAKILEVTLRDDLSYGVEWFFRNAFDAGRTGFGLLDLDAPGIGALVPGFSYTVLDNVDQVRLALNLLAQRAEINVLSSPSLMVLDNQQATINVGDEIPVPARQSVSNLDPIAPTVNEITFRQTGVTLTVTPRVNSSGLVTMDIQQEVATAAVTTTSNIDAPTIQNRNISSVVAISSGDTIVLGGLMQDQAALAESGLPFLHRIPVLGKAFGRTTRERARTELLVLITPRVVRNSEEARAITDEFRQSLRSIELLELERGNGAQAQ